MFFTHSVSPYADTRYFTPSTSMGVTGIFCGCLLTRLVTMRVSNGPKRKVVAILLKIVRLNHEGLRYAMASAFRSDDEHVVIGLVGQLAKVPLDGAARLFPVGGQDRQAVLLRDLPRDVICRAELHVRVCPHVLDPLRFAAGGDDVLRTTDLNRGDRDYLRLLAGALHHRQGLTVADAGRLRDWIKDVADEPRGLEVGHEIRV